MEKHQSGAQSEHGKDALRTPIAPAVCALCCFPRDLDLMSCPLLSGDRKTLSLLRVRRSFKKGEKGPTAKIKTTKPYTEKPRGLRRLNPTVPNNNF